MYNPYNNKHESQGLNYKNYYEFSQSLLKVNSFLREIECILYVMMCRENGPQSSRFHKNLSLSINQHFQWTKIGTFYNDFDYTGPGSICKYIFLIYAIFGLECVFYMLSYLDCEKPSFIFHISHFSRLSPYFARKRHNPYIHKNI